MPVKTKRRISPPKTVANVPSSGPESEAPATSNADTPSSPNSAEPSGEPPLLRVADAAHALRVSERSIHNYLAQGLLERVRIGTRTLRISRVSLLRLMGQPAE
jgi:hypothetical protein